MLQLMHTSPFGHAGVLELVLGRLLERALRAVRMQTLPLLRSPLHLYRISQRYGPRLIPA